MSISSTIIIPLIPTGESSLRAIILTIELARGQVLSPAFTNADIIVEFVYKPINIKPVV